MVNLFYSNRPFALLLIPIFVAIYSAINSYLPSFHFSETINLGFWGEWKFDYPLVSMISANAFVVLSAILVNLLYNRNEFQDRNSYLPSLIYIVIASSFHSFYYLSGFSISLVFLVLSLRQVIRLNQNEDGRKTVFNTSFLLAVGISFYPVLLCFIPFIFWIIWVFRPFIMRESILALTAILIPFIYAKVFQSNVNISMDKSSFSTVPDEFYWKNLAVVGFISLLLFFMSAKTLLRKIQQGSIRLRKIFNVLIMLIFASLLIAAFEGFAFRKLDAAMLLLIPGVLILPYAFGYKTLRKSSVVLFYILFLVSVGKFFYELPF